MSKPVPEREARLRTLIDWLRHPEWAPRGSDVCADDIEALLDAASSPATAPSDLEARVKMLEDCIFGHRTYSGGVRTVYDHKDPTKVVATFEEKVSR